MLFIVDLLVDLPGHNPASMFPALVRIHLRYNAKCKQNTFNKVLAYLKGMQSAFSPVACVM